MLRVGQLALNDRLRTQEAQVKVLRIRYEVR